MPQTDTCRFSSQLSGLWAAPYAYEKFGVLFKSPRPRPPGWVTGLPARVRRHLTSAIGIRKAGHASTLHIEPPGERKRESVCSYGRAVAKIVCALRSMTLKCNTQRASFPSLRCLGDEYNSIPITLLRTALHHFPTQVSCLHRSWHSKEGRILLIESYYSLSKKNRPSHPYSNQ